MSETPQHKKFNNFLEWIKEKQITINMNLFKEYFNFDKPTDLKKKLFEIKDKDKNSEFVKLIKVRWSNSKDKIKKMPEDEKKKIIKKPDEILKILEEIFEFNKQIQSRQGLKILTQD